MSWQRDFWGVDADLAPIRDQVEQLKKACAADPDDAEAARALADLRAEIASAGF